MKQLTCEICGSTDLVKQDGVFVCQGCGCKYTLEEAKKMMGMEEGSHPVTIKIDASNMLQANLENARGARQRGDYEGAARYYDLVLQGSPNNSEAVFYIAYATLKNSLVTNDLPERRNVLFSTLKQAISVLADNFDFQKEGEQRKLIKHISSDLIQLSHTKFIYQTAINFYDDPKTNANETFKQFPSVHLRFIDTLKKIAEKYKTANRQDQSIYLFQLIISQAKNLKNCDQNANSESLIRNAHARWHEVDPSHQIPTQEALPPRHKSRHKSRHGRCCGCYVATCVYGSYDCPEVWTLRRYRDETLGATRRGRAFIRTYYAISPTLVKWFGKTKWFKKMWRGKLDRMVAKLQSKGVENTPYEDKNW